MIYLTRQYRFPAAHRLAQPRFSDDENRRIFGKCANPHGHGHDYAVEVSVTGPVDEESGEIIPLAFLDRIVETEVLDRYSHRMLNDVPPFETLVPTAENIALVIHQLLEPAVADHADARLAQVRIIETAKNYVEYGEIG